MMLVDALSLNGRVNLPGIAATLLLLYTVSSNRPWWRMHGCIEDQCTFSANISPFAIAVEILGRPVNVPIIPYLTLAARLSILLAAIAILVGSVLVRKPWSKPMISMTGLALPVTFLLGLFIGLKVAGSYLGIDLPLTGKFEMRYAVPYGGLSINVLTPAVASLTDDYWIALTAGAISALAKAIHGRMSAEKSQG
jgi:hypothetical protein